MKYVFETEKKYFYFIFYDFKKDLSCDGEKIIYIYIILLKELYIIHMDNSDDNLMFRPKTFGVDFEYFSAE